jgi:delta 1-pyrroline-5-carboxylate dehydrogenase
LPPPLHAWLPRARERIDALLVDGEEARQHPAWLRELRVQLAAQEGPIVPVVIKADAYALEWLLVEQSVSRNTAALGGDARLLALEDDAAGGAR